MAKAPCGIGRWMVFGSSLVLNRIIGGRNMTMTRSLSMERRSLVRNERIAVGRAHVVVPSHTIGNVFECRTIWERRQHNGREKQPSSFSTEVDKYSISYKRVHTVVTSHEIQMKNPPDSSGKTSDGHEDNCDSSTAGLLARSDNCYLATRHNSQTNQPYVIGSGCEMQKDCSESFVHISHILRRY